MRRYALWLLAPLCAVQLAALPAAAQGDDRDRWQRVPEVVRALGIGPGGRVADVGAGSGFFTERLSPVVGAAGRVFAVDVADWSLRQLERRVRERGLANVTVVRGALDDPRLEPESVDAVLVVDAYHDMDQPAPMLAGMLRALRPGGRLVMVDFAPSASRAGAARARQTARHELSPDTAARELREAGFEVVERVDVFARQPGPRGRLYTQWMLVARRPAPGEAR